MLVVQRCHKNSLQNKLDSFTTIEQALIYFEIGFDSSFIKQYGKELSKRFKGNLILGRADDWFSGRRALKQAYCKIQRGRLDKQSRSACRGCTTCERR
ncbi:nitrogen fixation protein NifW [Psychromonas sp.]|uniref:nitrogen fixation protein NifW n=1 Tax=Psychromonas sp. TaxID=1884585 RepID=UPI0039E5D93B